MEGSITELRELRASILHRLGADGDWISVEAEVGYDPSPYEATLSRLVVRRAEQPVCVTVEGEDLRLTGSWPGLEAFCSYLAFDDGAAAGNHAHYEYWDGHPFIAPNSRPLVISVGYSPTAPSSRVQGSRRT